MPFIRSISGLRATLDDALTPEIVTSYTAAFAAILPPGPIVVGRDGRPSGVWIEKLVLDTLTTCGREVHSASIVPTPTVQLLAEHSSAVGGLSITASHNPSQWNGLKFIGGDGAFIDADENEKLWSVVDANTPATASIESGVVVDLSNALTEHIDRVLAIDVVQGAPMANGECVVVDAVNASGSVVVPDILERMGYTVVRLFCDSSGEFPHIPEPVPENLTDLAAAVLEYNAAFGVAVDPDADRLVLIGGNGKPIGEERTITLATQSVYAAGVRGPVVVNYSTTRMVDDVAAHYGQTIHRAAVGEINVVKKMDSVSAVIGGEGSGGVIYAACHRGRDSIVGLALITALLRKRNQTLDEACAALPAFTMVKQKVALDDRSKAAPTLKRLVEVFDDATISTEDGVHLAWPDRWAHIRASNTEPIMRIIAEAPDQTSVDVLVQRITDVVESTQ